MRISELRREIEKLSKPIFLNFGFDKVGDFGESFKIEDGGNRSAILIDVVKDSKSFSISVRVYIRLSKIEELFESSESSYTFNKLLSAHSLDANSYSPASLKSIVDDLVIAEANSFISKYRDDETAISNLKSSDYGAWVTGDKVAQFKIQLASAFLSKNHDELEATKNRALEYCRKSWSEPYREEILSLCSRV